MMKEVGLEGRLEGGERGLEMQGKREGVPDGWAIRREGAGRLERGECKERGSDESERVPFTVLEPRQELQRMRFFVFVFVKGGYCSVLLYARY